MNRLSMSLIITLYSLLLLYTMKRVFFNKGGDVICINWADFDRENGQIPRGSKSKNSVFLHFESLDKSLKWRRCP